MFNVAFFDMFGMYPRKFPLDVSLVFIRFFNDFICIFINYFLLIFRNVNLKPTRRSWEDDNAYGRETTAVNTALSVMTRRRISFRRLLPPLTILTGSQAPLLQKAKPMVFFRLFLQCASVALPVLPKNVGRSVC